MSPNPFSRRNCARVHNLIARKRAEERNRDVLRATELGVTIVDEEGFILSMDDNARQMFGLSGAIESRHFANLLVAEDGTNVIDSLSWLIGRRLCSGFASMVCG